MKYFLISWSNEGLEGIVDITEWAPENYEQEQLIAELKGTKIRTNKANKIARQMKLRAQFNPQRVYECYTIQTNEGIEEEDLRDWADTDIQGFVDWIRDYHYSKVFDTRNNTPKTVIV